MPKITLINTTAVLGACAIVALASVYFFKLAPLIILAALIGIGLTLVVFKNPVFGIFLIAFLLPFERIGSFELAGITVRASQIFAVITLIAWALNFLIKRGKVSCSAKNPAIIPMLLLTGFSILSIINAVNTQRAFIVLAFNSFVMVVSIMIPNLVQTKENLNKIIKVLLVSCFLVSLFGLYQFLGDMAGLPPELTGLREHYTQKVFGFPRIQSTALEPLYFANYLLIPISLGIALILRKRKKAEFSPLFTTGIIIIVGLAVINLILTLSRGGFLGLLVVLLLTCSLLFKSLLSIKKIAIIAALGLMAIISSYSFLKITGENKNIDTFLTQATSVSAGVGVEERFSAYEEAIKLIKIHPIIGHGLGNFGPEVNRNPYHQPEEGWAIVNNEFLEILVEVGILGLLSFLLLIAIVIARTIKALRTGKDFYLKTILLGFFIAFLGILAQYQTFSILYILHIWFLIGLMVATQNLLISETKQLIKLSK